MKNAKNNVLLFPFADIKLGMKFLELPFILPYAAKRTSGPDEAERIALLF